MRRRSSAILSVITALGCGLPTAAFGAADIQETLRLDGNGSMVVNANNNPPGQTWTWESCNLAGMACSPFGAGQQITTEGAPPNVIFRATSNLGTVVDSKPWRGTVSALFRPSVTGTVRANELVTPVPGSWTGGWDDDLNLFQLAACRSLSLDYCITLTNDLHYPFACAGSAAILDPALTGRYLRVANVRFARETAVPGYAVTSPYSRGVLAESQTVSAAFVGQIAPPTGPRQVQCGPPRLENGSISKRGAATISCLIGCRAVLSARRGKRKAGVVSVVASAVGAKKRKKRPAGPTWPPSYELKLSPKALRKLGPGKARLVLRIDGERVDGRNVRLRPSG